MTPDTATSYPSAGARTAVLGIVLIVTLLAYWPGLNGPFVFDDAINITENAPLALERLDSYDLRRAAFSDETSRFKRPLAMVSFALNHYFAGGFGETFSFKLTNLVIHLLNVLLVYCLAGMLLARLPPQTALRHTRLFPWLPLFVAALWALHPLHLTSVLYVVQRMTSLSALCVFAGLIVFLLGRRQLATQPVRGFAAMGAGLLGGTAVGILFKENAALLPLFTLLIEYLFFGRTDLDRRLRMKLVMFYGAGVVLPTLVVFVWLLVNPDILLGGYTMRPFNALERLLTEARVLWLYIGLALLPDIRNLTLYHDDILLSSGMLSPPTTLPAVFGLAALIAAAIQLRKRQPVFSFAILWYLVGHAMESGLIPLEIAHEHRNYVPDFGLFLGIGGGVALLLERLRQRRLAYALAALIAAAPAYATHAYSNIWASRETLAQFMVRHHPGSGRSHAFMAELLVESGRRPVDALQHYHLAAQTTPHEAGYLLRMLRIMADVETLQDMTAVATDLRLTQPSPALPAFLTLRRERNGLRVAPRPDLLDEIDRRLARGPVVSYTEQMLTRLVDCALEPPQRCRYLRTRLMTWLEAAAGTPRTSLRIRKNMLILLGKLHQESDNYVTIRDIARRGLMLDPADHNFLLMLAEADYYLAARNPLGRRTDRTGGTAP